MTQIYKNENVKDWFETNLGASHIIGIFVPREHISSENCFQKQPSVFATARKINNKAKKGEL